MRQIPMLAQFITQLGLEINQVVEPAPGLMVKEAYQLLQAFLVEHAVGSPYIPAQAEFVVPYGVKSLLGIGGLLPNGSLFVVTLFAKTHLSTEVAGLFRPLALNVGLSLLPFMNGPIYQSSLPVAQTPTQEIAMLTAHTQILKRLIGTYEEVALEQFERLEETQHLVYTLSSPIIPVMAGVIILPIVGNIDSSRAKEITRSLLEGIDRHCAEVVILDITGVAAIDSSIAGHLDKTIRAARLKGTQTIITGITSAVAETIIDLGIDWSGLETANNLQAGLAAVMKKLGRQA